MSGTLRYRSWIAFISGESFAIFRPFTML